MLGAGIGFLRENRAEHLLYAETDYPRFWLQPP